MSFHAVIAHEAEKVHDRLYRPAEQRLGTRIVRLAKDPFDRWAFGATDRARASASRRHFPAAVGPAVCGIGPGMPRSRPRSDCLTDAYHPDIAAATQLAVGKTFSDTGVASDPWLHNHSVAKGFQRRNRRGVERR